jgi:hypothetical protein
MISALMAVSPSLGKTRFQGMPVESGSWSANDGAESRGEQDREDDDWGEEDDNDDRCAPYNILAQELMSPPPSRTEVRMWVPKNPTRRAARKVKVSPTATFRLRLRLPLPGSAQVVP